MAAAAAAAAAMANSSPNASNLNSMLHHSMMQKSSMSTPFFLPAGANFLTLKHPGSSFISFSFQVYLFLLYLALNLENNVVVGKQGYF